MVADNGSSFARNGQGVVSVKSPVKSLGLGQAQWRSVGPSFGIGKDQRGRKISDGEEWQGIARSVTMTLYFFKINLMRWIEWGFRKQK